MKNIIIHILVGIWLIKHATVIFGGGANKSGLLQHNINGEKYFSTLFVDTKKSDFGIFSLSIISRAKNQRKHTSFEIKFYIGMNSCEMGHYF